jgi:outer membrane immunogenic protein
MRRIALGLLAGTSMLGLASAAYAADLARPAYKAPPPPPPPIFSWTGFYIGAHVGGAWGTTESTLKRIDYDVCFFTSEGSCLSGEAGSLAGFAVPISQTQSNGFLGGVQAGYNWQLSPWFVLGVEGQVSWTDLKGTSPCVLVLACKTEHDWIATLAARVGFSVDRAMLYLKGGAAWAQSTYSASLDLGNLIQASTSVSDDRFGVMFGAGVEYAFLPNWSAKIEYNFIRFRDEDYDFPVALDFDPPAVNLNFGAQVKETIHLVKAGVNYRFNWGKAPLPVMAKY